MKKIFLLMLITLFVVQARAQYDDVTLSRQGKAERNFRIPLIGEKAPSFTAESTNGTINFPYDFGAKWKILFSHPQDFTPVCSTEILQLAKMQDDFKKLGIELIVVSTDELETHAQWKKSMETLKLDNDGPFKIKFPLVDDDSRAIAKEYGMIHPASNSTRDVRGVFIIDPDNIIQAIYFYPSNVGRNTDELLRMVTALKTAKSNDVLMPVNWRAGDDVLVRIPPKTDATGTPIIPEGYSNPVWYLWFKKINSYRSEN
jgi:peroxiredoxin 2/4